MVPMAMAHGAAVRREWESKQSGYHIAAARARAREGLKEGGIARE